VWLEEYAEYADAESGEVFDVDWNTEGDLKAVPEDGLRHADTVIERPAFEANWYCLDPDAAGIQVDDTFTRNATWAADRTTSTQSGSAAEDLDADRHAARAWAEAEQAEADERERRTMVALNKLGATAIGGRRAFVTTLLARKTLSKGAAQFVADCLARDSFMLTHHQAADTAAELLGTDGGQLLRIAPVRSLRPTVVGHRRPIHHPAHPTGPGDGDRRRISRRRTQIATVPTFVAHADGSRRGPVHPQSHPEARGICPRHTVVG